MKTVRKSRGPRWDFGYTLLLIAIDPVVTNETEFNGFLRFEIAEQRHFLNS